MRISNYLPIPVSNFYNSLPSTKTILKVLKIASLFSLVASANAYSPRDTKVAMIALGPIQIDHPVLNGKWCLTAFEKDKFYGRDLASGRELNFETPRPPLNESEGTVSAQILTDYPGICVIPMTCNLKRIEGTSRYLINYGQLLQNEKEGLIFAQQNKAKLAVIFSMAPIEPSYPSCLDWEDSDPAKKDALRAHEMGKTEEFDKMIAQAMCTEIVQNYDYFDGIIIRPAGNYGKMLNEIRVCPQNVIHPKQIVIGEVDANGILSSDTNYGYPVEFYCTSDGRIKVCETNYDLTDPSCYQDKTHGTSGAAARFTQYLARMWQENSQLTIDEIKDIFKETGKPAKIKYGSTRKSLPNSTVVNIEKALQKARGYQSWHQEL